MKENGRIQLHWKERIRWTIIVPFFYTTKMPTATVLGFGARAPPLVRSIVIKLKGNSLCVSRKPVVTHNLLGVSILFLLVTALRFLISWPKLSKNLEYTKSIPVDHSLFHLHYSMLPTASSCPPTPVRKVYPRRHHFSCIASLLRWQSTRDFPRNQSLFDPWFSLRILPLS